MLISENTGTSNITLTNSAPDQTVILTGAGITAITGTYPTFTVTSTEIDGSTSNEIQNLSLTGQTLGISLGGTSVTLPVVNVTVVCPKTFPESKAKTTATAALDFLNLIHVL